MENQNLMTTFVFLPEADFKKTSKNISLEMARIIIPDFDEKTELIKWFRFLAENRCPKRKRFSKLKIDFRNTEFVWPFQLVSLACLIEEYRVNGAKIKILFNIKSGLGQHLRNIGYHQLWIKKSFKSKFLEKIQTNTIPVWHLKGEDMEAFLNATQKFYESHKLKNKDLTPLRTAIVESLNNIIDHSKSITTGYVISQYYPGSQFLQIVVCDFGEGIPMTVNRFLQTIGGNKLKPEKALVKSLEKGFSSKSSPHNRGFGLDNIVTNVEANYGELLIISNNGYLLKQRRSKGVKTEIDKLTFSFSGTFIEIKLNAKYFQEIDNEKIESIDVL